ncbi:Ankyrin repeat domain-containing protein SOWAHB-like isoform X1 [Oopsacas minuta]|uniref:Ankyrin repeat domain-containing protein SOWAHB-like isoform X1 n=1 Tax=Oopsacas minuta TaxID=111878 RepID=A0AAV7JX81_9METZ|nr:Ankyrin repeat domain-containing protein SOWAHB-like isoform X1 [Oopsacas minuta]
MIEILSRQTNFQKNASLELLNELNKSGICREYDISSPQDHLGANSRIKFPKRLSQTSSPLYVDTKWSDDSNSERGSSSRKETKLQFIGGVPKSNCNHQRVKSENLEQLMKEDLDELQNKINLQAQKSDKHRHSIHAIFDTFNNKKWIHKRISTGEQPTYSPEKSLESSLNSSSLDLEASLEIKENDRNSWNKSARECDADSILRLLTRDTHLVNCADHIFGYTALHWAAKKGRNDIIAMLLTSGALIDIRSVSGSTPLHLATQSGKWNVVETLVVEFRADIKLRDNNSRRAIEYLKPNAPSGMSSLLQSKSVLEIKNEIHSFEEQNEIIGKERKSKTLRKMNKTFKIFNYQGSSEA